MGLFSTLLSKVFGGQPVKAEIKTEIPASTASAPAVSTPATATTAQTSGVFTPVKAIEIVDVTAILDALAKKNPEKLDWKKSIVDLLKLVDMDSSLSARKELAEELNYTGDVKDSAKLNVWLHKEVLKKIAANGGNVPADLLD